MANYLPIEKKTLILSLLSEGHSIRSTERLSGVHRDTIMRLMVSVGELCENFMQHEMVNLNVHKVQCNRFGPMLERSRKNLCRKK